MDIFRKFMFAFTAALGIAWTCFVIWAIYSVVTWLIAQ